jgi:hypothetical protein
VSETAALATRIARLEAMEGIQALKARYTAFADAKYTPDHERVPQELWQRAAKNQAACFTEDAEWIADEAFGGSRTGRAALEDWFTRSPWRFALHFYLAPRFGDVAPDSADATWRLWQIAIPEDGVAPVLLAGITHEIYRNSAEGWLIAAMRFTELHRADLTCLPVHLENLMPLAANGRQ